MKGRVGIIWLLSINVVIWIALTISGTLMDYIDSNRLLSILSLPATFYKSLSQPWSLFTYMFTQYSALHIFCNMLCLLIFGFPMAQRLGNTGISILYILGGLAGALSYFALHAISGIDEGSLCGASAAVLSVMSAALIYIPQYPYRLPHNRDIKLKWLAAFCCIFLIISADGINPTSGIVHSGGMIFGLLAGLYLRRNTLQRLIYRFNNRVPAKDINRYYELMEKIRMSGYPSLSNVEKEEIMCLDKKIKNN